MRFLFALALLVGASAFAKGKDNQPVYGICYSSTNCQGLGSNQPVTLAQCENMIDESYRHNGGERYGSWTASHGSATCGKPTVDAQVVLANIFKEGVRITKWYKQKYGIGISHSPSWQCSDEDKAHGCRVQYHVVGGDYCECR